MHNGPTVATETICPEGSHLTLLLLLLLLLLLCVQNLREAIATYRGRLMAETKESRRATLMAVCIEYLERWVGTGAWSRVGRVCAAGHVGRLAMNDLRRRRQQLYIFSWSIGPRLAAVGLLGGRR
jgi:hypothetical protein